MIERIVAALGGKTDYAALQALCAALVEENDALRLENAKLRAANRALRRRLAERELAQLRRAETDAAMIGGLLYAQLPTSRRACLDYGISRRRWAWAMALLKVALVRRHDGGWRDVAMADFEDRLRGAVGIVERDGLQVLVDRMPHNGRSGRHHRQGRAIPAGGHGSSHAHGHAVAPKRDHHSSALQQQTGVGQGALTICPQSKETPNDDVA